ncbi:MAG: CsgG/HfaB family protein [Nitrospirota bacterium]
MASVLGILVCAAGTASSLELTLKPLPRDEQACAGHKQDGQFHPRRVVVLPFSNSDKSARSKKTTPDGKKTVNNFSYPVKEDGEHFASILENALMSTGRYSIVERAKIQKLLDEMKLQHSGAVDSETMKKFGQLSGADTIIDGKVIKYLTVLRWQTQGKAWFNFPVAFVAVEFKMIDVATGTVLFSCQKSGNSENYLDREYLIDTKKSAASGYSDIKAALHGSGSLERLDHVARQLTKEAAAELRLP